MDYVSPVAVIETEHTDSRINRWLFEAPLWQLCSAAIAAAVILFGVGVPPHIQRLLLIAQFPGEAPDPTDFMRASPLGPILAGSLGATDRWSFAAVHFVIVVAALAGSVAVMRRYESDMAARLLVVAWFCSPLANVMLSWLGMPDPFTLFAAVCVMVGPPGWVAVGAGLLGFNHFEQGGIIIAASLVIRSQLRSQRLRPLLPAVIVPLLAGRGLLWLYHQAIGARPSRLGYVRHYGLDHFAAMWAPNLPTLLFSVYGVLWLPLLLMWRDLDRRGRRVLAGIQVAVTLPVLITVDLTRVYALVTMPILIFGCCWWAGRNLQRLPWLLAAAVLVPRVVLWSDTVYVSSWRRLF